MKNKLVIIVIAIIIVTGITIFTYSENQKYNEMISNITEKIYVALEGSGEVAVVNTTTNRIFKKIDLSENKNGKIIQYMSHNVQVSPDNKSVWVTANASDKKDGKMSFQVIPKVFADNDSYSEELNRKKSKDQVIIIDPYRDIIIKRIEIGQDLHLAHVSLTPDNSYAIVASQEKGIIYKINTSSFEIEKEIVVKQGGGPHGLRISPDGKTAYIAMLGGKSLGILDIASFTIRDIPLKGSAVQTGVTPDGKYALASIYETKSLAVYDIISETIRYVDLPKEAKGPVQIYPTPDSRYIYIADQGYYFDQPTGNLLYKIDLQEMKVVRTIKGGSAPHGVVVSADGKFVYVTNLLSDDVSVIDTVLEKEITKIKVGDMPNGISLWYSQG